MNKKLHSLLVLLLMATGSVYAQPKYIVKFKDKGGTPFSLANPSQYLTQRAINRRSRYNIPIDSTDLPVLQRYIDSLRLSGAVSIVNVSRWFNQVCIQSTDMTALSKISAFPFVVGGLQPFGLRSQAANGPNKQLALAETTDNTGTQNGQGVNDFFNYGLSYGQIHLHNGEFLHNHGFRGQGMQMVVTDAGFLNYLTLPTFDSIRNNGQILGTWDFVDQEASVNEDNQHGMQCFSVIAANMPGQFVGAAPKSSFYLYRTENASTEHPIEEQNWLVGIERADSLGVDAVSNSLGYTTFNDPAFNHTYADMNGNTTLVSRAADMAAKKGMLVTTSAGNDGNGAWRFIGAPADADSVLVVGGVNINGQVVAFSSYGPSSDGQVKPDVVAVGSGTVIANLSTGQPNANGSGTSFAAPNIAGLATCLWQAFPEVNNMTIIDVMRQAADKYTTPNDRYGYGIPDMKKAFVLLVRKLYTRQSSFTDCKPTINWTVKTDSTVKLVLQRMLITTNGFYTPVLTIQGQGAFASRNFGFTDELSAIPTQAVRYRLAMSIGTDTTFYLDSVTINHNTPCTATEKITISPNPVGSSNVITVRIIRAAAVEVNVVLHNTLGQRLYTVKAQQAAGGGTYNIPMLGLPKGVYYVTVYINGDKVEVKKVVK